MAHFLCHSRPALGTLRDQEVQPRSEPKKKNENFAPTTSSRDDLGSVLPPRADTDVKRVLCHGLRHVFDAENRHHRNNDVTLINASALFTSRFDNDVIIHYCDHK